MWHLVYPPAVISMTRELHTVVGGHHHGPTCSWSLHLGQWCHIRVSQSGPAPGNDDSRMPRHFKYTSKSILKLGLGVEWCETKHLAFRISKTHFKGKALHRWKTMRKSQQLCQALLSGYTAEHSFRCTKDKQHCQFCSFCVRIHRNNICNWLVPFPSYSTPLHLKGHMLGLIQYLIQRF